MSAAGWNVVVTARSGEQRALRRALSRLVRLRSSGYKNVFTGRVDDPDVLLGLGHLARGEWFLAHEVLERAWRDTTGLRRLSLQALIQGAVALEHLQRERAAPAWGQWQKARAKLVRLPAWYRGIGLGPWRDALDGFFERHDVERHALANRPLRVPDPASWPRPPLAAGLLTR